MQRPDVLSSSNAKNKDMKILKKDALVIRRWFLVSPCEYTTKHRFAVDKISGIPPNKQSGLHITDPLGSPHRFLSFTTIKIYY